MVDIPLKLPEIGNALMQGAHAAYYTGKARQEENAFQGEQAARPDIAAAIGGDQGAQGRVAQASPTTFAHIAPHIAKLDADKRAQAKAAADFTAHATNTLLQADPKDRAAVYQQMIDLGKAQGHDMSTLPPQYTPAFDTQARLLRGQSKDLLTLMQQQEQEAGRNRRHETHGGGTAGGEIPEPGTRPATPAAPGPRADAGPMPGTPPVSVAQAAPGPAAAPPPQMAQGAAPVVPQPSGGPQIVQGDSPGPSPQPVAAPQAPAGGIPQGFQPMGHRDATGNLVPALIDGKPVYRNAQGQMMLGDAPAGPPPSPAVGPIAEPPPAGRMGLNAPPDLKETPKPDLKNGQLVYEDPALLGGVRMGRQMPNGTWAPTVGVGESHKYKLPNGTEVFFNPHLKRPIDANGVPSDVGDTHGDEFRATPFFKALPFTDRAVVDSLLDGSVPISQLAKRGGGGQGGVGGLPINSLIGIAKQIDPSWSPNEGEQGKRFAQSLVGNGQNAQTVTAANIVPAHAADLVRLTDAMGQNNPKMIQELINKVKEQTGDQNIVSMDAARFVTAMELVKAAMGPAALNVEVEKEARRLLASGNTAGQMRAAVSEWTDKVASRAHYLQDLADTYHLREPIMRGDAKKAMAYLKAAPGTGATGNFPAVPQAQPTVMDQIKGVFGGSSAPAPAGGSVPTMTPEQVRAAPPGTKYRTIDGREGVRP